MKYEKQWNVSTESIYSYLDKCKINNKRPNLVKAGLHKMNLKDIDFHGANLFESNLTNADLGWADLSNTDISNANLTKADLIYSNLSHSHLSDSKLSWADLSYANLKNADLSKANLRNTNLHKSILDYVNLSNANLYGADLSGVDLSSANLTGVIGLGTKEKEQQFAKNLLQKLESGKYNLEMTSWHTCKTTHCIAGFYSNHRNPGKKASTALPTLTKYFYASNEEALAALRRVASGEESVFS